MSDRPPGRLSPGVLAGCWLAAFVAVSATAAPTSAPTTVSADADTAVARFSWADSSAAPVALWVVPPAARLGELVAVVVDGATGAAMPGAETLRVDADWLEPAFGAESPDLAGLPPPTGPRLVLPCRVYRLGPWQPAWDDGLTGPVQIVRGRLTGEEGILPVRDPRGPGGLPRWLPWLLLAVVLATVWLAAWRRWRRDRRSAAIGDRPLPPPAWLEAALRLQELERTAGAVSGRVFLDRLAAILRAYLRDRYHLAAVEMTAAEIAVAATAAGWPEWPVRGFCALLADCDRRRYAPPAATAGPRRPALSTALDLLEQARIEPVWSTVPPVRLAAATSAWRELRARYPRGAAEVESC